MPRLSWVLAAFRLLTFVLALGLGALPGVASDLDQQLRDQYQGKTLVLRGFYSGNSLRYDSGGSPSEGGLSGDWTVDGVVRIDEVRASGDRLKIRATRVHLGWVGVELQTLHDYVAKDKPDKDEKKDRELRIEAALSAGGTAESAVAALSRIFLTSQDSFAEMVPDYWKPCVRSGLGDWQGAETEIKKPACHFSQEFLAIPGVALHSNSQADAEPAHDGPENATSDGPFHTGKGVSPPKVLQQSDPEFSEAARRSKFQGTVTLSLVVDTSGTPTDIRILSPIGSGLDAQAVRAVRTWRFRPGAKDGQIVRVEIAVETDFHLF
jgi:TonB family protein